jgi:hypothetical protein
MIHNINDIEVEYPEATEVDSSSIKDTDYNFVFDDLILQSWKSSMFNLYVVAETSDDEKQSNFCADTFVDTLRDLLKRGPGSRIYDLVVGHYYGVGHKAEVTLQGLRDKIAADVVKLYIASWVPRWLRLSWLWLRLSLRRLCRAK